MSVYINSDNISLTLGQKIRNIRKERNLKIAELAEITGLTVSMISQVERGIISPSIESLKKIGNAMDIHISSLFQNDTDNLVDTETSQIPGPAAPIGNFFSTAGSLFSFPPVELHNQSPVVHRDNRKILSPSKGIIFQLLNPNLNGPIQFIYNEYEPGSSTGVYSHPGSECGLILSGELLVQVNDDVYILKEGDSITFNSTDPHMKKNVSDKLCTCVWANVPPWF